MRRRDPKAAISGICGRDGTQLPNFFRRNPLILPETAKEKFGNPNFRALISLRSPKRNLAKSLEKAFFQPRDGCVSNALLHILDFDRPARQTLRQRRLHEGVEVAVEYVGRRAGDMSGTEVLDHLVRLQDVRSDLMAPADIGLRRRVGVGLGLALLQLHLI